MSASNHSPSDIRPKATPSLEEIAAWEALPAEEQLRRLRESFEDPECSRLSNKSMEEILAEALRRVTVP
jgi:hypothetical protein